MTSTPEARPPELRGAYRAYLAVGLLGLGVSVFYRAELVRMLDHVEVTVNTLGPLAPLAMTLVSGIWATLCLPGPVMLGLVGTMFAEDPLTGIAVALGGDTIATIVGFQVARRAGRRRIQAWLESKPWFGWLERHTESRGVYGVFFLRMMPFFPNSLANYALGLSALKFGPYLAASVLGSIPNVSLYVLGTAGTITLLRDGIDKQFFLSAALLFFLSAGLLVKAFQLFLRRRASQELAASPPSNRPQKNFPA